MIKGYKVFNSDWTCRGGFQYEVGKTFEEDVTPVCCDIGLHFCTKAVDCFNYYPFDHSNKVAEVEALGDIDTNNDDSMCSTNKIHIIRELSWHEVLDMVNLGKDCTGLCNSGDYNSGDYNSGDYNSGDYNSGSRNSGDYNSGSCNSGNYNSGNFNSGSRNSGDWNKTRFSNGCFNTKSPKIFLFNKPSDWTYQDWLNSDAKYILRNCPSNVPVWVHKDDMTDEEKEQHPEYLVTNGYLKNTKPDVQSWWDNLTEKDKKTVKAIPNFDAEVFKEITGITV